MSASEEVLASWGDMRKRAGTREGRVELFGENECDRKQVREHHLAIAQLEERIKRVGLVLSEPRR